MKWIEEIRAHFAVRRELSPAELAIEFACGGAADQQEVMRCLEIFHAEYGIEPGLLRASDSMTIFTDAPKANPLTWIWVRAAYEDRLGELSYRLEKARIKRGLEDDYPEPVTLGEYVCLFQGMEPAVPSANRERIGRG